MSINEKVTLIENCMDLEEGTLHMHDNLLDFDEWDSLTALSIISVVAEKYNKVLNGEDLKKAKKVSDIVKLFD